MKEREEKKVEEEEERRGASRRQAQSWSVRRPADSSIRTADFARYRDANIGAYTRAVVIDAHMRIYARQMSTHTHTHFRRTVPSRLQSTSHRPIAMIDRPGEDV